ncbi:hypothetical protein [Sulfitobacter sp. 915]|uniref:hypothetical protein n=1 Tax=Sulfitobacter sp. 915 TaxID=3368558 RepID=UPI003745CE79
MTDATPMFSAHFEQLIHELKWADDTPDEVVTLVAGNIRGAVSRLIEDGVLVPVDEVSDRVAELFETAKAIAAMRKDAAIAALTPTPQEAAKVLLKWSEKETPAAILLDAGWTDQQATTASVGMEFMLRAISEDSHE